MSAIQSLSYIVVQARNLESWRRYVEDVLGKIVTIEADGTLASARYHQRGSLDGYTDQRSTTTVDSTSDCMIKIYFIRHLEATNLVDRLDPYRHRFH